MKNFKSLLFLGCVMTVIPISLLAQSTFDCDSTIVDNANVFHSNDLQKLQKEVNTFIISTGADVRVRTYSNFGSSGSLERLEKSVETSCPSWTSLDGGTKNNLLVLMVAMKERKTGLYYGTQWNHALSTQWTSVQANYINPRFRDHDFAGGFANGLIEINHLIDAAAVPSTSTAIVIPASTPSQPTDFSGLWMVLGALLALSFAVLIVVFTLRKLADNKEEKEAILSARQRALIADQDVATSLVELNEQFDTFAGSENDKKSIKLILSTSGDSYNRLKSSVVANPEQNKLSAAQYVTIANQYEAIQGNLKQASRLLQGYKTEDYSSKNIGFGKGTEIESLPDGKNLTNSEVQKVKPRYSTATSNTYHTHTTEYIDNTVYYPPIQPTIVPVFVPVVENDYPVIRQEPHYVAPEPTPSYDPPSGGSSNYSSGDSGYDSSNDGGSSSFSSSDSGDGGSSDF